MQKTKRTAPSDGRESKVEKRLKTISLRKQHVVAAAGRFQDESLADLVGSVHETNAAHEARHPRSDPRWTRECTRCAYQARKVTWEQVAEIPETVGSAPRTWLAQRPSCLGGAFGFGCCVCAGTPRPSTPGTAAEQRRNRSCTKWARYDVRNLMGI